MDPDQFTKIPETFIQQINFSEIFDISEISDTCRLLKITDISYFNPNALRIFESEKFINLINSHQHVFVILLEVKDSRVKEFDKFICQWIKEKFRRPLIIEVSFEVYTEDVIKVWYKDKFDVNLELYEHRPMSTVDFEQTMKELFAGDRSAKRRKLEFSFKTVLRAMWSGIHVKYNSSSSIADIRLEHKKWIDELKVHEIAAAHDSALTLRFLNIFGRSKIINDKVIPLLRHVKCFDTWLAVFNIPMTYKFGPLPIQLDNIDVIIIECINLEAQQSLRFFLRRVTDVNKVFSDGKRFVDILWEKEKKNPKLLREFLTANSCYPKTFDITSIDDMVLKDFIDKTTEFHDMIIGNALAEVQKFIDENPNLKIVYNLANKSACATALSHKRLDIYVLLRSKKFRFHNAEDIKDYSTFLSRDEKEFLTASQRGHFESLRDSHLLAISEKSKLGFNHDKNMEDTYFNHINDSLIYLNKFPIIKPILRLISKSKNLNVIFDFNRDSVDDVDPSKTQRTLGTTYLNNGYIYVGARKLMTTETTTFEDKCEVYGVIVHEFTHFAIQLAYCNNALPYAANDMDRRSSYKDAYRRSENAFRTSSSSVLECEEVIYSVFFIQNEIIRESELIVRVVHLIAQLSITFPKILQKIRKKYKELFIFFETFVWPDIERIYEFIDHFQLVRDVNEFSCKINEIKSGRFEILDNVVRDFSKEKVLWNDTKAVRFSHPNTTFLMRLMYQFAVTTFSQKYDATFIFIDVEFLKNEKHRKMLFDACRSPVKPTIVMECPKDFHEEQIPIETFDNKLIIIESACSDPKKLKRIYVRSFSDTYHPYISNIKSLNYDEKVLTRESREMLRENRYVKFQSVDVSLDYEDFEGYDFVAMELPKEVNRGFLDVINSKVSDKDRIYVNRNFRVIEQTSTNTESPTDHRKFHEISLSSLVAMAEKEKVMILSGEAGIGKTTSLKVIASYVHKLYSSTQWITFLDLKLYVEIFENKTNAINWNDKSQNWQQKLIDFFVVKILKIQNEFEKRIFIRRLRTNSVILFCDGFDEVCPQYMDFVTGMLRAFTENTRNQLWVTTRSNIVGDLEKCLGKKACELSPISDEAKQQLLMNFLYLKCGVPNFDMNMEDSCEDLEGLSGNGQDLRAIEGECSGYSMDYGSNQFLQEDQNCEEFGRDFAGVSTASRYGHDDLLTLRGNSDEFSMTEKFSTQFDENYQNNGQMCQVKMDLVERPMNSDNELSKSDQNLHTDDQDPMKVIIYTLINSTENGESSQDQAKLDSLTAGSGESSSNLSKLDENVKNPEEIDPKMVKSSEQDSEISRNPEEVHSTSNFIDSSQPFQISSNAPQIAITKNQVKSMFNLMCQQSMSTPLQVELFAEVYLEELLYPTDSEALTNSFVLYKRFVQLLIKRWRSKGQCAEDIQTFFLAENVRSIAEMHHYLALRESLKAQIFEVLKIQELSPQEMECLKQIAIVKADEYQRIKFLHDTFAEYYISDFLLSNIFFCNSYNGNQVRALAVLLEVLIEKRYQLSRKFLNDALMMNNIASPNEATIHECQQYFHDLMKGSDFYDILHIAVEEGHVHILRCISKFIQVNKKLMQKVWMSRDENGRSVLLAAVSCKDKKYEQHAADMMQIEFPGMDNLRNCATLIAVLEEYQESFNDVGLQQLLEIRDNLGNNCFHVAAYNGHADVIEFLWSLKIFKDNEKLRTRLIGSGNNDGSTVLQKAVLSKNLETVEVLFKVVFGSENRPSNSMTKSFITSANKLGQTVLHLAAVENSTEIFTSLLNYARIFLTQNDYYKFLYAKDKKKFTAFHIAAANGDWDINGALINSLQSQDITVTCTTFKSQPNFLTQLDDKGRNGLVMALAFNSAKNFEKMAKIYQNFEIKNFILMKTRQKDSTLQLLIANNSNLDIVTELWKNCRKILDRIEMRDFLMSKNSRNENFLHTAAKTSGKVDILGMIWKMAVQELNRLDLVDLLECRDKNLNTPLHLACENSISRSQLNFFINIMQNTLNLKTLRCNFMLKNAKGLTTFSLLVSKTNNVKLVKYLWKACSKKLNMNLRKSLLMEADKAGNYVLQLAAINNQKEVLEVVWEILHCTLKRMDDYLKILLFEDQRGRNIVYKALMANCNREIIETLWKFAKDCDRKEKIKFIVAKPNRGYPAIAVATNSDSKLKDATIASYWEIIEETLPREYQDRMLNMSVVERIWMFIKFRCLKIKN